jgi:hypothetical protein
MSWNDDIHPQTDSLLLKLRNLDFKVYSAQYDCWKEMYGPLVDELMQSREKTLECIRNPDDKTRAGALTLLAHYWSIESSSLPQCMHIFYNDKDVDVRCAALACIFEVYKATRDMRLGRMVGSVIRSVSMPLLIRQTAYVGLLELENRVIDSTVLSALINAFDASVDWDLVNKYV